MEIINYFDVDDKPFWLREIGKSDWGAGQYLYRLLSNDQLLDLCGGTTKVLMLTDGKILISFCTLAEQDEVRDTSLTPWIGFVYTFPEYRGRGYIGKLLEYARNTAYTEGAAHIYISTDHIGLYEKYGYTFYKIMKDNENQDCRVYKIDLKR